MERYYRIEFTASLQKMTLAFKMQCQLEIFWKRGTQSYDSGEKIAETGKVPFKNCTATFNKDLTISCNMVFDSKNKLFKEKQVKMSVIKTKFAIVIYTEKGNKQAGQIIFDVAPFLNERNQSKSYELELSKCPDKNAKLSFKLKAQIMEEKAYDAISQSSLVSVDVQSLTNRDNSDLSHSSDLRKSNNSSKLQVHSIPPSDMKSATSIMTKNKEKNTELVPTTDRQNTNKKHDYPAKASTDRTDITPQTIQKLQTQNKKIKQQLKRKDQLKKQNEDLKRKLKDDDYESSKQYKKKIEQGKKEIELMNQESKGGKKLNQEIKKLEKQILKCKEHIMRIFNEAQKFGPEAMDKIQQACGIREY